MFKWLGDRVARFLSFSDAGAKFVFGDNLLDHPFAFKVSFSCKNTPVFTIDTPPP